MNENDDEPRRRRRKMNDGEFEKSLAGNSYLRVVVISPDSTPTKTLDQASCHCHRHHRHHRHHPHRRHHRHHDHES